MKEQDFLVEIGTEELPSKALKSLSKAFAENIEQRLQTAAIKFGKIESYATPRRLALLITQLTEKQADRSVEKRGPALRAAFDEHNKPTPALEGFARSCNTTVNKLEKLETPQGSWMVYRFNESGKHINEIMPEIINEALKNLPINKPMRWADLETQFARPVQWAMILYGKNVLSGNILDLPTSNVTYGHRFHHPKPITIKKAETYADVLEKTGFIIANFDKRREAIHEQILACAKKVNGEAIIDNALLDEVTSIVEWPVALTVHFDESFLKVPKEALMTAMQHHQKSFPVIDKNQNLLPLFIAISNIESKDREQVIKGNERVMRARLSDAKFFYETDCKHTLAERLNDLKTIVFQAKLGSLYDKAERIAKLANIIAQPIKANIQQAERAGLLAKADLTSAMVNEFPELQGIMGYYYAKHDGENSHVAQAIREHYLPRFAGDDLPATLEGCATALADRLDTLVGIFGINQAPTGDKDPFGLRRAALGVLRILLEKQFDLNLTELLTQAAENYTVTLPNTHVVQQTFDFIYERFRTWYQERGITSDVFAAAFARRPASPFDFDRRVKAIQQFQALPQASALIAANKRVSNILVKENQHNIAGELDSQLFEVDAEKQLAQLLAEKTKTVTPLYQAANYQAALAELAKLQPAVDAFFDKVMVMVEDAEVRHNRLLLLAKLREHFLSIADISLLQA